MITPYVPALTQKVATTSRTPGSRWWTWSAAALPTTAPWGGLDPVDLFAHRGAAEPSSGCDAVVLSACVQMPSLAAIPEAEARLELPVLSAATATTYELLTVLGRAAVVPDAGYLLSKEFASLMTTQATGARQIIDPVIDRPIATRVSSPPSSTQEIAND